MVGRLASFWEGLFSGAMIFFGMVIKTIVLPKVSKTTPFESENHVEYHLPFSLLACFPNH